MVRVRNHEWSIVDWHFGPRSDKYMKSVKEISNTTRQLNDLHAWGNFFLESLPTGADSPTNCLGQW